MNYEIRKLRKGIRRIYYNGNPVFSSIQTAIFQTALIGLFHKYVLVKYIPFFSENKSLFYVFLLVLLIVLTVRLMKNTKYIQWDNEKIIFNKVNGITDTILVSNITSIKIIDGKGIDISYKNHIYNGNNGIISIPFENLGRNFNTDVDIIKEDFKMLFGSLIIKH